MTRYQLVIITKDVAFHYYQSEDKLYRLFLDYHRAYEWARPILEKQIRYITDKSWQYQLNDDIRSHLRAINFVEEQTHTGFSFYSRQSNSSLHIEDRFAVFQHEGDLKEEWEVFDCLKKISPFVFAVNMQKNTYGWLKPLKVFSVL